MHGSMLVSKGGVKAKGKADSRPPFPVVRLICTTLLVTLFLVVGGAPFEGVPLKGVTAAEPKAVVSAIPRLRDLERNLASKRLTDGRARCSEMAEYYWDANRELEHEFKVAQQKFDRGDGIHRRMILVAGPAGIGKTFVKRNLFAQTPSEELWKFDVRELFDEYSESGCAQDTADLCAGKTVFNQMLALTPQGRSRFEKQLLTSSARFIVVDSLDEVHPTDYVFILRTLERWTRSGDRNFAQVVVFGRPFSFADYWSQSRGEPGCDIVRGFTLKKPEFRTTGDIQVSNWNFDSWKFGLRRGGQGKLEPFSFSEYQDWCERGFPRDGEFSNIVFEQNRHMNSKARQLLNDWISDEPAVAAVVSNLAGNGMVRDILVEQMRHGRGFDERHFMEQFLARWLERDTRSDDRPSQIKPDHLDAYLRLLENTAARFAASVGEDGSFRVPDGELVGIKVGGRDISVSVKCLLNRSGLVTAEPFGDAADQYRFEPLWLHRYLAEQHRSRGITSKNEQTPGPVALR